MKPGLGRALKKQFGAFVQPGVDHDRGRLVKTMGDGFLVEFGSVRNAAQCSLLLSGRYTGSYVLGSCPFVAPNGTLPAPFVIAENNKGDETIRIGLFRTHLSSRC